MQTSKKVLITTVGILLALFISSLMVMRSDVQAIYASQTADVQMTAVPVEAFGVLHFAGHWNVQVRQGRTYQVEVAFDSQNRYLPQLENRNDTLHFLIKGDSSIAVKAKVITPVLRGVKAENAYVTLKNFQLDSMTIKLDASHLTGKENKFIYTSYETIGNSKIEFLDDPYK
ncbi:hypothetical protein SAMN04488029_0094 [Reichenbachiella faecimaris]|uniref:Uncharacterized protein n=1 Tax=Reichenbachiella faecimaris TaxID=692418 RepID=A0A1W2G505_REIFA|nr:hypothetical protein [Reichenbachiella faecimaris]SMD31757.1 hypothetical protein SAMN04488029_0094 [Reichenbachiella faecimaris]